jgi:hypothetical protein
MTNTSADIQWKEWNIRSGMATSDTIVTWTSWISSSENHFDDSMVRLRGEVIHQPWPLTSVVPTPEEAEQIARRQAELAAEQERKLAERARCSLRANELLMLALDESQRRDLRERGAFQLEVLSRDGSTRRYEIWRGRTGNVYQLDEAGRRIFKFCAHPQIACPEQDTMLAQKLMLEADEEGFLALANRSACA